MLGALYRAYQIIYCTIHFFLYYVLDIATYSLQSLRLGIYAFHIAE